MSIAGVIVDLEEDSVAACAKNRLADVLSCVLDVLHALSHAGTCSLVAAGTLGDVVFARGDKRPELFV
jgi:hypothetical protein